MPTCLPSSVSLLFDRESICCDLSVVCDWVEILVTNIPNVDAGGSDVDTSFIGFLPTKTCALADGVSNAATLTTRPTLVRHSTI